MAEQVTIEKNAPKALKYEQLLSQMVALVGEETDHTAVLANAIAALHHGFKFFWTGIYMVKGNQLILGPFQGPVACMRIELGKGVCGMAWKNKKTLIVPDVDKFPGHIACSAESKSEIVIPLKNRDGEVMAVLDIDSNYLNTFDQTDAVYLEKICEYLSEKLV
ncbi:MAG: GAF domain-containing protein [Salibacteraceae bacterium]